jgi:hypothetical protein
MPRAAWGTAVNVDEDQGRSHLPRHCRGRPASAAGPGGFVLEDKLKLKQMPTTWVVDRTGHVRYTQESFDGNLNDVRAKVDTLLREGQ